MMSVWFIILLTLEFHASGSDLVPAPPPPPAGTMAPSTGIVFSNQGDNNLYGSNVIARFSNSGMNCDGVSIFVNVRTPLPQGRLSKFYAYFAVINDESDTYVQIWRHTANNNQTLLVWQACLPQMSSPGLTTFVVPDVFYVQPLDFIGWSGGCGTISFSPVIPQVSVYTQTIIDKPKLSVGTYYAINPDSFAYDFSIAVEVLSNATTSSSLSGITLATSSQISTPPSTSPLIVVKEKPDPERVKYNMTIPTTMSSTIATPVSTPKFQLPSTLSPVSKSRRGGGPDYEAGTPPPTEEPPQMAQATLDKTTIIIVSAIVVGGVVIITAAILVVVIVVLRKRTASASAANAANAVTSSSRRTCDSAITIVDDVSMYDTVHDDGYTSLDSRDKYSVVRHAGAAVSGERMMTKDSRVISNTMTSPGVTDVDGYLILLADGDVPKTGPDAVGQISRDSLSHPLPALPHSAQTSPAVDLGGISTDRGGFGSRKSIQFGMSSSPSEALSIRRITSLNEFNSGKLIDCGSVSQGKSEVYYTTVPQDGMPGYSEESSGFSDLQPVTVNCSPIPVQRIGNTTIGGGGNHYLDLIY